MSDEFNEEVESKFHNWVFDQHAAVSGALIGAQENADVAAIELAIKVAAGHRYSNGQRANPESGVRGDYEGRIKEVQFLTHLYNLLSGVAFCLHQGGTIPQGKGESLDTLWEWYEQENS